MDAFEKWRNEEFTAKDYLKPCPFCGVMPKLYCNLEDWRGAPRFGEGGKNADYALEANHKSGCFIRQMNGMNDKGKITAFNWQTLIEYWNQRSET